jgi:hypothetical protein
MMSSTVAKVATRATCAEDVVGEVGGDAGHGVGGHHDAVPEVDGLDGQADDPQVERDTGGHHRGDTEARSVGSRSVPTKGDTP